MTYINKVAKLLLQLGYWDRFGAVSSRSITETCADANEKSGPAGRTATIARCGMEKSGQEAGAAAHSAAALQWQRCSTSGTLTAKTVPRPTCDRTVTGWSSIWDMRRTMDRPRPSPRPLSRCSVPQR